LSSSQGWNRYGYVRNSPIVRYDPSGHDDLGFLIGVAVVIILGLYDLSRRHDTNGTCEASLADCFNSNQIKEFSDNESIDHEEFNDLQNAVYKDLNRKWFRTPWDPARGGYDTPFFDGNPRFGEKTKVDHVVCVENKCSNQSAVNYFAQGMYSAHTHEPLFLAKGLVHLWNLQYGHLASDDEIYWLEEGYKKYKDIKESSKKTKGSLDLKHDDGNNSISLSPTLIAY